MEKMRIEQQEMDRINAKQQKYKQKMNLTEF